MKKYVRCKACGFVMEESRLRDTCPACGVAAKVFEPYDERISPVRHLILKLDIHPVLVHFPQAFTATILLLSLVAMGAAGGLREKIVAATVVLGVCLPFVGMAAFLGGLLDGKVRFRKLTTPMLKLKIVVGIIYLAVAGGIAWVAGTSPALQGPALYAMAGLSAVGLGLASVLGMVGVGLLNAKFPG